MNKRGFLYTIMVLFILTSVLWMAMVYMNRTIDLRDEMSLTSISDNLLFIESDLSSDFLDIIGINSMNLVGNNLSIEGDILVGNEMNITGSLDSYRTFVETSYIEMTNFNITINEITPTISITPVDYSLQFNNTNVILLADQSKVVDFISIIIQTDSINNISSEIPVEDLGDTTLLLVKILNSDDSIVLDEVINLDSNGFNQLFQVEYPGGDISVRYGKKNDLNGTLEVWTDGINANIKKVKIGFSDSLTDVQLRGGINYIMTKGDFTKSNLVLLYAK